MVKFIEKRKMIVVVVVMAVMSIMAVCFAVDFTKAKLTAEFNTELQNVQEMVDAKEAENEDLNSEVQELYTQVYRIVEGKSYDVTITRDGHTITYKKDRKGIFSDTVKNIVW